MSEYRSGPWPSQVIAEHLHERRGHNRKRWWITEALSTGGFSLILGQRCSCLADATAALTALMDAGFFVEHAAESGSDIGGSDAPFSVTVEVPDA